ncbi:MAG TPA: hypothetical protein VEU62_04705 [Bryobacterales bacterium]|nr:hypothetical protein [Bryobacterales bacterium]
MPRSFSAKPAAGPAASHAAILLISGLALRAWLIVRYPPIFGGDAVTRLANRERILILHQLPALQASIHYLSRISTDPLLIRCWMALLGAVAGVGFYYLATDLMDRAAAFWAALFFVANPLLLAYSIVPYQEILMLAALAFAFHFFFTENLPAASLCLAFACLTRYEAWAACPVLVVAAGIGHPGRPIEWLRAGALFGWAPLAWVLYNAGLSPAGTSVLTTSISALRLERYVYLVWITVKNTPLPELLLAGLGLWIVWKERWLRKPRFAVLAAFLVIFLVGILFSAHGSPLGPERFVSAREAHLPIAATILLAGLGLGWSGWRSGLWTRRVQLALAAAGVALGIFTAARFVAQAAAEPQVQLAYRLARYLDATLRPGDRALVLAKAMLRDAPAGIDTSAEDYQRTLIQSRLGRDRLLPAPPPGKLPEWIAVWSDFSPADAGEARVARLVGAVAPVQTFRAGALSVRVYRIPP